MQQHLGAEEALYPGNVVLPEIAHLPEGRVGNVVCRPSLGRCEIPFLATSGVDAERQIALSDLAISLRDDRIVLQRTNRLTATLPELAASLVHMHLNRMLRAAHREQETVLADFLARIYGSRLARELSS